MATKRLTTAGFSYSYEFIKNEDSVFSPIFIVNGAFQSMKSWKHIISLLKEHYSIIVSDLPGWGDSDLLPSIYGFEMYNEFLREILLEESIDRVNLVSCSFGTLIATSFAKCHPTVIDNLILCSPILKIKKSLKKEYPKMKNIIEIQNADKLAKFLCKIGLVNCKAGHKGKIDHFDILLKRFHKTISKSNPNELGKFLENTNRIMNFPQPDLGDIASMRSMVLSGCYDEFTSSKECKKVAAQFESCDIHMIPKSDHMFLHEQPVYSANMIDGFLKSQCGVSELILGLKREQKVEMHYSSN